MAIGSIPLVFGSIGIQIYHVRDSGIYYGGDEVKGFVEVKGPLNVIDAIVEISFSGITEAQHVVPKRVMKNKATFFDETKILFKGTVVLEKDGTQTWPFTFQLPTQTEPEGRNTKIKYTKKPHYMKESHAIPPSASLSDNSNDWMAQVVYQLYAKINGKGGTRQYTGCVTVVPPPQPDLQDSNVLMQALREWQSEPWMHVSSQLLPGQAQGKRTMNKWLSDKVSKDTPRAVFSINMRTITIMTAGVQIPVLLKLLYDTEKSTLPSVPEVRLLEMKYSIKAWTQVVGSGFLAPESNSSYHQPVFERRLQFDSMSLVNGEYVHAATINVDGRTLPSIHFDQNLVPAFTTYNIRRMYLLSVSLHIECGGKRMKTKFDSLGPLNLVYKEGYASKPGPSADPNALENTFKVAKVVAPLVSGLAQALA